MQILGDAMQCFDTLVIGWPAGVPQHGMTKLGVTAPEARMASEEAR
jgi:hypothetical protein